MRRFVGLLSALLWGGVCHAAPLIVETEPLVPNEQQTKFRLPDGFEIQLVASEPDIGPPMNLNFDAAGRLWVTHSLEYPYPVAGPGVEPREARWGTPEDRPPRDRLSILADFSDSGRARQVTHFVDGLNIPIGQTPVEDGAIVYGIPAVSLVRDLDGDGHADSREVLYEGFGNVDTHGMVNSLTRWIDGWVYACHGFRNTSNVCDAEGQCLTMNSGNTFRFRPDGSRIESHSRGQVNPFGLAFSPWGDMFVADCHSKPITLTLRGAYYSSFGKPHDGLGFGPDMIDHSHGSTGICGAAWMDGGDWPAAYHDSLFICNPVNGIVHHDQVKWDGSSPRADTQPEFIVCDDPWFRPVDVQVGPNGALYVADFYNAIIGHYEVPLEHPRRDRARGRIWRIVRSDVADGSPAMPDLTTATLNELIEALASENLTVRTTATHQVVERFADEAGPILRNVVLDSPSRNARQRAHALWALERIESPLAEPIAQAAAGDADPIVRTHLAKVLAERTALRDSEFDLVAMLLVDAHPMVRRAAADAAGRHPRPRQVSLLMSQLLSVPVNDTHLRHVLRMALRDHLRQLEIAEGIDVAALADDDVTELASICMAVPEDFGAALLLELAQRRPVVLDPTSITHVLQYRDEAALPDAIEFVRNQAGEDRTRQREWLDGAVAGLRQRGLDRVDALSRWMTEVAESMLDESLTPDVRMWLSDAVDKPSFAPQQRTAKDGRVLTLWSSFPPGEAFTGVFRSEPFSAPEKFAFQLAGHDGFPTKPAAGVNRVTLRSVPDGAILETAAVPRNDVAQPVEWDLRRHQGREVTVEVEDGDSGSAFAWLAAGGFSVPGLNPGPATTLNAALEMIEKYRLTDLRSRLQQAASDERLSVGTRLRVWQTINTLVPDPVRRVLVTDLIQSRHTMTTADAVMSTMAGNDSEKTGLLLDLLFRSATGSEQQRLAALLSEDRAGLSVLLTLIDRGVASVEVFRDASLMTRLTALAPQDAERVQRQLSRLPQTRLDMVQAAAPLLAGVRSGAGDVVRGREVFRKSCATCHRIGGEGGNVGPQLDGIGGRGIDRVVEDLLDPNRNVDAAFRMSTFLLTSGKVINGLVRREEGAVIVVADQQGKELTIDKSEIDEQVKSVLSLMPANFTETLSAADQLHLLTFLNNQIGKPTADAAR